MLLGQYFGRRHQSALPAGVDAHRCCQRRHYSFARAHIALQQAVHRCVARHIQGDFFADPCLCAGQGKGQSGVQALAQRRGAGIGQQHRRTQGSAGAARLQLRKLLRQQFLGLQALPSWVAMVHQSVDGHIRTRVVQKRQRFAQRPQAALGLRIERAQVAGGKGVRKFRTRQPAEYGLAQIGLRQSRHRGVNGSKRIGKLAAGRAHGGVQHGPTGKATFDFAPNAQALAHRQGFLHGRVKVEKAQRASVRTVVYRDHQLATRAVADFVMRYLCLDLQRISLACVAQLEDASLVFVAQRQVQRQIDIAHQSQLLQRLLRRGLLHRLGRCGLRALGGGGAHWLDRAWWVGATIAER